MSRSLAFLFILLSLCFQLIYLILSKVASLRMVTGREYLIWYLASLACLGLQALCWPLALRRIPLFVACLGMSGIYIAIPLASYVVFGETVSACNIAGALVIIAGLLVMMTGGKEAGHV